MAEYIAKRSVLEAIEKRSTQNGTEPGFHSEVADLLMQDVKAMPASDVAQVKHAHWIGSGENVRCSCCGMHPLTKMDADCVYYWCYEPPFCPNCGAKMDKEVENHEKNV